MVFEMYLDNLIWKTCKAMSYVEAPVQDGAGKRGTARLPMLDPHELLNYLVETERVPIDESAIKHLAVCYALLRTARIL